MTRYTSIISRVIWLHVIAIGITSICMPLALYWLLGSTANDLHRRALRDHVDVILRYLKPHREGGWTLELPADLRELYSESYGRYAFAILDDRGKVLFSSLNDASPVFRNDPLANQESFIERPRGDSLIFGVSIPTRVGERKLWVQVAQDLAHRDVLIDDIVADFFPRIGWITFPILLLLLLIDIFIFRRALRPVLQASDTARTIGPSRTEVRLPTGDMPREILPLIQAVNQALDRLEQGFRTQREFAADAAHELRTPLAILRARIDTLDDADVREALRDDITGMTRIVNQLLDIAELANFVVDPGEKVDLQNLCAEVVAFIAPLALARGKSIALTGAKAPVWIQGNSETLFQAVRNLAENAIHHTPEGTAVEIEVSESGAVRVLDDGPGIPDAERDLVFRRFWRRDRRRSGGAGLGLSIVVRIVEAHAGAISVENRASGGAVFSMRLVPAG